FAKERLKRLIAYARNLGYEFIEVYTNATLIDDEMINFLAQEKVSCAISFYSHDKTIHDNITGVAGSQERTVETTQKLLAKEITIRAAIILSELNKQDLRDSIEYLQKTIGVPKVTWDYVRPIGRGANDFKAEEPHLTQEHEMRFNGIDADTFKQRKQGNACLNHHLCVSPDGNVYPCIMGKDVLMGNVLDQTLQEIVSSDKACDIWGCSKDRVSGCDMCEYRYACFDCRPKVFAMTNDLYAKPSDCLYDPYTGRWEEGKTQKRKETVC
ncbi:MAG: SPASM domain-containing protein, partial [Candidatus Omnitrophota bacterium]